MPIYGVDIHPKFQAGISIEAIRAEGFDFMATKVSEGRGVYDSQDWLRRGKACGLLCLGYHYLRPGDEAAQAAVFTAQITKAGVPGMLDAEALGSDGRTPTLTVAGIRRFLTECAARGARVPLLYLPNWYWQRMGSPRLDGLPTLWASGYVGGSGVASELYESVTPSRWANYGGLPVEVLQFTDKAAVAGRLIDANHYRGTRGQFAALIGASIAPPRGEDMPAGEWVTTPSPTPHVVCFPVGAKVSSLVAKGWLSLLPTTDVQVSMQAVGGGKVLAAFTDVARAPYRWWRELPDGTEGCLVSVSAQQPGVAGWCLELKPTA